MMKQLKSWKILKDKYELAILSNATATLDWCFDALNIRKYFKEIVISSYEESSKPGEDIYLRILRRMDKNPEDCIFIDDKKENIKTAEKNRDEDVSFKSRKEEKICIHLWMYWGIFESMNMKRKILITRDLE